MLSAIYVPIAPGLRGYGKRLVAGSGYLAQSWALNVSLASCFGDLPGGMRRGVGRTHPQSLHRCPLKKSFFTGTIRLAGMCQVYVGTVSLGSIL